MGLSHFTAEVIGATEIPPTIAGVARRYAVITGLFIPGENQG